GGIETPWSSSMGIMAPPAGIEASRPEHITAPGSERGHSCREGDSKGGGRRGRGAGVGSVGPELPARLPRGEVKGEPRPRGIIVQAEVGLDDKVICGVVRRQEVRAVPVAELTDIKTFAELDRELKEAAERQKDGND